VGDPGEAQRHYKRLGGENGPINVLATAGALRRFEDIPTGGPGHAPEPLVVLPAAVRGIRELLAARPPGTATDGISEHQARLFGYLGREATAGRTGDPLVARAVAVAGRHATVTDPSAPVVRVGTPTDGPSDWRESFPFAHLILDDPSGDVHSFVTHIQLAAEELTVENAAQLVNALHETVVETVTKMGLIDVFEDPTEAASRLVEREREAPADRPNVQAEYLGFFRRVEFEPPEAPERITISSLYQDSY
jgi:hypothetical protein